jgi:phage shock protein A
VPRDEVEAAYFTLLRAREELEAVRRYGEYLVAETQRLRRSRSEADALRDGVDRRLLRALRHSDVPLAQAITDRLAVLADEAASLPERIAAAEAYVEACERTHQQLRTGG